MTFQEWATETVSRVRSEGATGAIESGRELWIGGLRRINRYYPRGTNVYDREWDLLVLLDGCRVDLMEEVASDWSFLNRPDALTSVGSSSHQWLKRTFTAAREPEMRETAYVTANPFSRRVVDSPDLRYLDEVWRYAFDDDTGTIPPRPVTDRAIDVGREVSPDRLIVHYMQPHFPSLPDPLGEGMNRETLGEGAGFDSAWGRLRRGEVSRARLWESYRRNLVHVLEDVDLLLSNVDAERAVLSADHGNAIGEWGVYGHPTVPINSVRMVPWYRTSGRDEETFEPTLDPGVERGDLKEKLGALGYV